MKQMDLIFNLIENIGHGDSILQVIRQGSICLCARAWVETGRTHVCAFSVYFHHFFFEFIFISLSTSYIIFKIIE